MDWVCDNCGKISSSAEMIYINTFQKSKDSSIAYCKQCKCDNICDTGY